MRTNLLTLSLLLVVTFAHAQKIELHLIDDITGLPIENVEATVIFNNPASTKGFNEQKKKTNDEGEVTFRSAKFLGASLRITKDGYYKFGEVSGGDDFWFTPKELREGIGKTIRLRSVLNPIALYGSFAGGGDIPIISEWCGYDLEVSDWVEPHGSGKTADLLFRFKREFVGFDKKYRSRSVEEIRDFSKKAHAARGEEWSEEKFRLRSGDWDMRLEIAFPNEKEGIIKVVDEFNAFNHMRMPHHAPEEGYKASYKYAVNNYEPYALRDDVGFFLRTRVVLDEDGEIESANYAKVHGDFKMSQNGGIGFIYYYNPRPNDRNLEFDPKQNLFPEGTPGTFNFVLP